MLDLIRAISPYPTVDEKGKLFSGYRLHQPRMCQKCKQKDCVDSLISDSEENITHSVCPRGFSLVRLSWSEGILLCNGLIVGGVNTSCPPKVRKNHRVQKASWENICGWHRAISEILTKIEKHSEGKARELIEGLHDVSTTVSLVTRNAEAIINELPGETDEEKIDNASPALTSLLKSVELLHTRLSMSSIVANPESASFGQKHPTPIYKVFHRMARLFEEVAAKKHVNVRMEGSSLNKPNCFNSFDTLALVLLDNAVKYSIPKSTVYIIVSDTNQSTVSVAVQSQGPVVSPEIQNKIFERGFRTEQAEKYSAKGSGLGLYIARIIAEAHGFKIHYKRYNVDQSKNEGLNEFLFET